MNLAELMLLKFPQEIKSEKIQLGDRGKGIEITVWDLPTPKPTEEELDKWAMELELQYRQKIAVEKRVYPSIEDQLDMLYWDKINSTTVWVDTIEAIKSANPKPME